MFLANDSSITSKSTAITGLTSRSVRAYGCLLETDRGEVFIDWVMGLHGPLAGYSPDWWQKALIDGARNASSSLAAVRERQLAELLSEFYPWAEQVRFMSDGSSPNEAAVRIARAVTGKNNIAFCGYHGTGTSFPHNTDSRDRDVDERRGIPKEMWGLTYQFKWGDTVAISQVPHDLAAIVIEVPSLDKDAPEFLSLCQGEAAKRGALFIIDDVVTGFRVAAGGATEAYGTKADLWCLGKALGNGFNVSALIGSSYLMEHLAAGVHYSSTFNGAGLATTVALATLMWMEQNLPWSELYRRGNLLKDELNRVFQELNLPMELKGNPTRPMLVAQDEGMPKRWCEQMRRHGIYCLPSPWYVTIAHTEEIIEETIQVARRVGCGV